MYNYYEAIKNDVLDYIKDEVNFSDFEDLEDLEEELNDTLFVEDGVTGNASGSYTFSRVKAQEYVSDNLDLLKEAREEFGTDKATIDEKFLDSEFEWMDVTIRCYLLSGTISEILNEIEEDFNAAHEGRNEE